jgi:hypothetical protein
MHETAQEFLRSYPALAFCDECLARELLTTTAAASQARSVLAGESGFVEHEWFCSRCLRVTTVIHVDWSVTPLHA